MIAPLRIGPDLKPNHACQDRDEGGHRDEVRGQNGICKEYR